MSLKVVFFRLGYLLFNIYIDDLSISLSNATAGCKFGGMSVNHFSYLLTYFTLLTLVELFCHRRRVDTQSDVSP